MTYSLWLFHTPAIPSPAFTAPWDSEMTHFFINEYRNVSGMVTKKRDAFLHISDKMNQKGYDVTPYTVEKKWHNLIKAYKNVLYRAIRKGDEKISWEYFEVVMLALLVLYEAPVFCLYFTVCSPEVCCM